MNTELPDQKGTYIVVTTVDQLKRLEIGRLGTFEFVPGFYCYVGSAFGGGGLRARISHHLESSASPHWHIDYLLSVAEPVEVWYTMANRKLEHQWAELLAGTPHFRMPIPRFGASDYHRSRSSHLFYSKRRPSFHWFQRQLSEQFERVRAEQFLVTRVTR